MLRSLLASQITGVFGILIVMIIISHFLSPTFLTGYNLTIIMRALAFAGIVALGQCLLLILGELDLSIGAIAGLVRSRRGHADGPGRIRSLHGLRHLPAGGVAAASSMGC